MVLPELETAVSLGAVDRAADTGLLSEAVKAAMLALCCAQPERFVPPDTDWIETAEVVPLCWLHTAVVAIPPLVVDRTVGQLHGVLVLPVVERIPLSDMGYQPMMVSAVEHDLRDAQLLAEASWLPHEQE